MLHPPPYRTEQIAWEVAEFKKRSLTPYESNVASLMIAECRKALLREIRKRIRYGTLNIGPVSHLKRVLPDLSSTPKATKNAMLCSAAALLARNCMADAIKGLADMPATECISVARALHANAAVLDVKCHLPRVKKARRVRTAKPKTLVEARAVAAAQSLKNWKRKSALAKTKIAALQRKVTRYRKTGALT